MTVVDLNEKLTTEEVCFNAHYRTSCGNEDNATHTCILSFAVMNRILTHLDETKLVYILVKKVHFSIFRVPVKENTLKEY